ncbi:hypothetical protein A6B37_19105 [Achromobacter sp. HZ01]|nr:hypothetical protein A6B37_19105 [Achromobacter sp. HZ01]
MAWREPALGSCHERRRLRRLMGFARSRSVFLLKGSRAAPILHAHVGADAGVQAKARRMGAARQFLGKNPIIERA